MLSIDGVISNNLELPFKVTTTSTSKITQKWYKIKLYLKWQSERKPYMIYRILPLSMTLNDP